MVCPADDDRLTGRDRVSAELRAGGQSPHVSGDRERQRYRGW